MQEKDELEARRQAEAEEYLKDIREGEIANAQQMDKAVLTLSTFGLGFSITLVKLFETPELKILLPISWICFGLAILSTLLSYLTSQWALTESRSSFEQGRDRKEGIIKLAHITNNIPAFFFVGALIVIIVFGTVNYL